MRFPKSCCSSSVSISSTTRIKFQSCCNIDRFAYRAGMSCLLVLEPWKVDVLTPSSLMTTFPEGIYRNGLKICWKLLNPQHIFQQLVDVPNSMDFHCWKLMFLSQLYHSCRSEDTLEGQLQLTKVEWHMIEICILYLYTVSYTSCKFNMFAPTRTLLHTSMNSMLIVVKINYISMRDQDSPSPIFMMDQKIATPYEQHVDWGNNINFIFRNQNLPPPMNKMLLGVITSTLSSGIKICHPLWTRCCLA